MHFDSQPANAWTPPGPAMLFCPADRPERYQKALDRSDVVILDLEDAVSPENRVAAREALVANPLDPDRTIVRINPAGTGDYRRDLAAIGIVTIHSPAALWRASFEMRSWMSAMDRTRPSDG